MRLVSSDSRAALMAALLLTGCITLGLGCTTVSQTLPIQVVESKSIAADPSLANYFVTVHVILQLHDHPDDARRKTQNPALVTVCQEKVVSTALRLAATGVRAVVVEGLYAAGTPDKPEPVRIAEIPQTETLTAKWILANRSDLAVYGFELRPLNEFGVSVVNQLGQSAAKARELAKDGYDELSAENKDEYGRLIQDEAARLNLWYAGVIPERSFIALQTALAVALARRENQVQLIIGKQHWNDLVYAVHRHGDVRLRLVPYGCE